MLSIGIVQTFFCCKRKLNSSGKKKRQLRGKRVERVGKVIQGNVNSPEFTSDINTDADK